MAATDATVLGKVVMYEYEDLMGFSAAIPVHKVNTCYNMNCFDDKMSSAKWDLPSDWFIGFYADANCSGVNHWFRVSDHENVTDLYAVDSDLDNTVSSVVVLKFGAGALTYTKECTNDTVVSGAFKPT